MFLDTAGDFADVVFDFVRNSTLRVVGLDKINLSLLSDQWTAVLPLRWIVLRPVKVARKLDVAVRAFDKRNAEGMTEVLPDPLALRVQVLKYDPVVVLGVVDDFHHRVEVHRVFLRRKLRSEAVETNGDKTLSHRRKALDFFFRGS